MNKKLMMLSLFCTAYTVFAAETPGDEWKLPTHAQLAGVARLASYWEKYKARDFLREFDNYANDNASNAQVELEKARIPAKIQERADIEHCHEDFISRVNPFAIVELGKEDGRCIYFSRDDRGSMAAILPAMKPNTLIALPVEFNGHLWGDDTRKNFGVCAAAFRITRSYGIPLTIKELSDLCGGKTFENVPALVTELTNERTSEAIFAMCAKVTKDSEPQCAIQ